MNKVLVTFKKRLSGHLNGLEITDKIRFPSRREADTWVREIKDLDRGNVFSDFNIDLEKAA